MQVDLTPFKPLAQHQIQTSLVKSPNPEKKSSSLLQTAAEELSPSYADVLLQHIPDADRAGVEVQKDGSYLNLLGTTLC